jgi:hypothetical protein
MANSTYKAGGQIGARPERQEIKFSCVVAMGCPRGLSSHAVGGVQLWATVIAYMAVERNLLCSLMGESI